MSKQKGFTQEFEDEAVRLALTSGRTRRELAENLGVGLSTLTRWIGRRRDREIDFPDKGRTEDAAEELKRLRRENAGRGWIGVGAKQDDRRAYFMPGPEN